MTLSTKKDLYWMRRALYLASLFKGTTSPNPTVAAILVNKQGDYIHSAVTQPYGQNHAERELLQNLPSHNIKDATLYVTLEPCCSYGKTPPCTDIIIEKKIQRIVIAVKDYHTLVNGKGVEILKQAGCDVQVGLLEKEAYSLNEDFFISHKLKRPFIFAKYANSLDGFIKSDRGISNERFSNRIVDRYTHILRYRSDAILVGVKTIIDDNPLLTVRIPYRKKNLLRIILDPDLQIPQDSYVLNDSEPTLLVSKKEYQNLPFVRTIISRLNKEVFFIDSQRDFLDELLQLLYYKHCIRSLMIEGGAFTLSSFLQKQLIDKLFIIFGNTIVGQGLSPFKDIQNLTQQVLLSNLKVKHISNNVLMFGNVVYEKNFETRC